MILFLDDWKDYPRAVVHAETSNQSFVDLARLYKSMGIENYFFHLTLLNPDLRWVDPHSKDLSEHEMALIKLECRYNPWYFFREVALIKPQASANPIRFKANRGNISLYWLFFNHIEMFLIQPRQTGKSVSTDLLMEYLLDIGTVNTRINMLTKDDKTRVSNVLRLKAMRELLPAYLSKKTKLDANNTVELTCHAMGNLYSTAVAQASEAGADSIGRGLTSPIIHVDEVPYCSNIVTTLSTLLASAGAATDEAKSAGAPYGFIYTTTAGKKNTVDGKYIYDIVKNAMVWSEKLYDAACEEDLVKLVKRNSVDGSTVVNITMSHRQLGYTDEWLLDKIRKSKGSPDKVNRDYLNVWTDGGLSSPVSAEILKRMRASEISPRWFEISKDSYILKWYIPEGDIAAHMRKRKTILAMDMSEAVGRDSISMLIIDVSTLEVLAAASINETNLIRFSGYISDLMIKYQNMVLIPERRSTGTVLIDTLLIRLPGVGIDPFKRIYNTIIERGTPKSEDEQLAFMDMGRRDSNYYDRVKRYFGFSTSGSGQHSRDRLYVDTLQRAARVSCDVLHDSRLINEISELVTRNDRIDHKHGQHDDMVIAWLLTVWMLTLSKNLEHYGISNPMDQVKEYREAGEVGAPVTVKVTDRFHDELQQRYRDELKQVVEEMESCTDDYIAMKLEYRLRALGLKIRSSQSDEQTIDAIIRDAKEQRINKMRKRRNSISDPYFSVY